MLTANNEPSLKQKQETVFFFPHGIPGLERYQEYLIEPLPGNRLFTLLLALEDQEIGLILVDPMPFFPGYRVDLLKSDCQDLMLHSEEDLVIFTTVTVDERELYTNLAAPILINLVQKRGKQVILPERCEQMRTLLSRPDSSLAKDASGILKL